MQTAISIQVSNDHFAFEFYSKGALFFVFSVFYFSMVKPKRASKRLTTAHRAKIARKAREHTRKSRRETLSSGKKSAKKDPGIPHNLPFKEKVMQDAQREKHLILEEKRNRKTKRAATLEDLSKNIESRTAEYNHKNEESNEAENPIGLFTLPDNSQKAYFKEFRKVVQLSDVVLVVLDARDPLGSRVSLVEQMVMDGGVSSCGRPKRLVLILNKADLIPSEVSAKWVTHLRQFFPTIAISSKYKYNADKARNTNDSNNDTEMSGAPMDISIGAPGSPSGHSWVSGASDLIQLLKNYCRNVDIKTKITVGVVGFPNVGKSSLINSLKRGRKACSVGSNPGITQHVQFVHLDKHIQLLDSPGIVFSEKRKDDSSNLLFLQNCIRVEQMEDPMTVVQMIYQKCPKDVLMMTYNLGSDFSDHISYCKLLAKRLGKVLKGGLLDLDSTARKIVADWNSGKIPFYTLPPQSDRHPIIASEISSEWAREFSIDDYNNDNDSSHMCSAQMEPI